MKQKTKLRIVDFLVWMLFANVTWFGFEALIESKHWAIFAVATAWYLYAHTVDAIFKSLYKELQ